MVNDRHSYLQKKDCLLYKRQEFEYAIGKDFNSKFSEISLRLQEFHWYKSPEYNTPLQFTILFYQILIQQELAGWYLLDIGLHLYLKLHLP